MTAWAVRRTAGTAGELHAEPIADAPARMVWVREVTAPALVLGSAQPDASVDPAAVIDVVRRRSGGGAVLLVPGEQLWVDVDLPRGDPLWDDDVVRASWWLGDAWARTLGGGATAHHGGLVASEWSPVACFAGLGPGEVTVDGAKVVGISQRRTRAGARFQCVVNRSWEPAALPALLALEPGERASLAEALAAVGTSSLDPEVLVTHLP